MPYYASVAVDIAVEDTDRAFHYLVPGELYGRLTPGQRVLVPFGARRVEGFFLDYVDAPEVAQVKPIIRSLDTEPLLSPEQVQLARWLAEHTGCLLVQALRAFLPGGVRRGRARPRYLDVLVAAAAPAGLTPAQERAWRVLHDQPGLTRSELARRARVSAGVVKGLIDRGGCRVERRRLQRDPFGQEGSHAALAAAGGARPILTPAQAQAVARIGQAIAAQRHQAFLLEGVTGSGKTEVYLQAIAATLAKGRRAVVLVPEIALTPQTVERFRGRFGERVAVLHSGLSEGERFDQWERARDGEVDVVVGARSAIFAPLGNLGLIVVDEEHEATYKQEEAPRYHARDVALARGRLLECPVVLGSATPSLETLYAATAGSIEVLQLPTRVAGRPLPPIELVDMREERTRGNSSLFSDRLKSAVEEALAHGQQAILFLNRRGFSPVLLCRECGHALRCPHCAVTLTFHQATGRLHCHYCDFRRLPPDACPSCGSVRIRYFGVGTEQVETLARQHFPSARILRMDVDTTAVRGAHERIYRQFREGDADILVGTQMVAKGWDIEGVTVVGVVSADTALHLPDFRSAERTFQLLVQVAGRAGRGGEAGRVIVQTYDPEHYAVQAAARHDVAGFAAQELALRAETHFPPFAQLVRCVISGRNQTDVEAAARTLAAAASRAIAETDQAADVLGPAEAPLKLLRGRFRWHFAVRGGDRGRLLAAVRAAVSAWAARTGEGDVRVAIDPDPYSML